MAVTGSGPERARGSLGPALELATAWSQAGGDPGFYWATVERVMADVCHPDAGPDALAEVVFGLSSLGAILLDRLAASTGRPPADLVRSIANA